jgi:hypothetical protein
MTTWQATSRKEITQWRELSLLMDFGPGLMNQSSNVNQHVTILLEKIVHGNEWSLILNNLSFLVIIHSNFS